MAVKSYKNKKPCPVCNGAKTVDLQGRPVENGFGLPCKRCLPGAFKKRRGVLFWNILTVGDVEPELHGPYKTSYSQDHAALMLKKENDEDGIYGLIIKNGKPKIFAYSGGFMDLARKSDAEET